MTVLLENGGSEFRIERVIRLFLPEENISFRSAADEMGDIDIRVGLCGCTVDSVLMYNGAGYEYSKELPADKIQDENILNLEIAHAVYKPLCDASGYIPPWGMLTGIRPVKLLRTLQEKHGSCAAREKFVNDYRCSEEKYSLAAETEANERPQLLLSRPDSFSLYISIPFCPTRCSYCSFVSQSVEMSGKLIPEYVEKLCLEIKAAAEITKQLGLRLETIYMGGGTPTTLSAAQLRRILGTVNEEFDISQIREYTVEAGRPDTVTAEKLAAIKECGADRVSINPQTMNGSVLEAIGRKHSPAEVIKAYHAARDFDFKAINMDLIAGLPKDSLESFENTLNEVLTLTPENITVHTLSMKRASRLNQSGGVSSSSQVGQMLSLASERLHSAGYIPYYLYRQTKMLGNMENVGWSKPSYEGLYNIYIMDETHSIIAVGAGGVTKLKHPYENYIERIYNYKFPYEYLERFDVIIDRKKGVRDFYEKFG